MRKLVGKMMCPRCRNKIDRLLVILPFEGEVWLVRNNNKWKIELISNTAFQTIKCPACGKEIEYIILNKQKYQENK